MDDPWAWSANKDPSGSSKPSGAAAMVMPADSDGPPPRFDEADPWGINAVPTSTQIPTSSSRSPAFEPGLQTSPDSSDHDHAAKPEQMATPAWGQDAMSWNSGSAQPEASASPEHTDEPTESHEEPDHADPWGVTDTHLPETPAPPIPEAGLDEPSRPPVSGSSSPTPPRVSSALAPSSPPADVSSTPSPAIPQLQEGFASTSRSTSAVNLTIPNSPSFGDDFGGFSTGAEPLFAPSSTNDADPWGMGQGHSSSTSASVPRDEGWGGENLSWGGDQANNSWGGDTSFGGEDQDHSFGHIIPPRIEEEDRQSDHGDEGWGGSRLSVAAVPVVKSREEDDWEEAQRRIRIKQEKAPQETIDALTKAWTELLGSVITSELEKMTGAEEMKFEETVQKIQDDIADKTRSLSTIPPDVNTYPPTISSLITHERFVYALQRPNPAPSSSLLHSTTTRRAKRVDPLSLNSSSLEPSWSSRSMLGEPDAPPVQADAAQPEEAGKGRWSFWGKRPVPERQLTTSGGGVLEVKAMSPTLSMDRASSDIRPPSTHPSRAPSISNGRSRPASPAPSFAPSMSQESVPQSIPLPSPSLSQTSSTFHPQPQAQVQAPPLQPAPSAVSRFFGRLGRKQSATAAVPTEVDANDMELSADDFSFLEEVPSMSQPPPERGVGDLLALEPGRGEQIASLESLLNSKAAPSPKPLAPPPRGSSPAGSSTGARSSSGRFVARMKAPAPTDMDLLGDLNFTNPSSPSSGSVQLPTAQISSPHVTSPSSAWDDFLSLDSSSSRTPHLQSTPAARILSPPIASPVTPIIAAPLVPSRSGTPSVSLSPPPPPASSAPSFPLPSVASASTSTSAAKPASTMTPSTPLGKSTAGFGEGDFDDFGTPQHASTSTFDDFGDFSMFDSVAAGSGPSASADSRPHDFTSFTNPSTQTPVKSSAPIPTSSHPHTHSQSRDMLSTPAANHARPGSLDHTPTLNLMTGASASKGKRWPAPPSPIAPVLAPPPKQGGNVPPSASAGFPFISPPPPGRPSSRGGVGGRSDLLGDGDSSGGGSGEDMTSTPTSTNLPARSSFSTPVGLGMGMGMGMGSSMGIGSSPLNPSSLSSSSPAQISNSSGITPSSTGNMPEPKTSNLSNMFGGSLAPTNASMIASTPPISTGHTPAPNFTGGSTSIHQAPRSQGRGKGGLSAQDLSFFDSL